MAAGSRKESQKSADKKYELAMHAMFSLAELGFARINLRDIAVRSGVSLGVIHYYFANKTELLIYCVSVYKEEFIADSKTLIEQAEHPGRLLAAFADFLSDTLERHAHLHRLWYDARAQALFDPAFQPVVTELESLLADMFHVLAAKMRSLGVGYAHADPLRLYIAIDGWFRYFLQQKLNGDETAAATLRVRTLEEFCTAFPGA